MDVKNYFDFGSPFDQSHNGALMSFALDGVGFKVAEFTVKVGKVDSPLVNALAKLTSLPPPFYVTIGATDVCLSSAKSAHQRYPAQKGGKASAYYS